MDDSFDTRTLPWINGVLLKELKSYVENDPQNLYAFESALLGFPTQGIKDAQVWIRNGLAIRAIRRTYESDGSEYSHDREVDEAHQHLDYAERCIKYLNEVMIDSLKRTLSTLQVGMLDYELETYESCKRLIDEINAL